LRVETKGDGDSKTPESKKSIDSVSPSSGVMEGNTFVSITGSGFQNGATVTFGGQNAASVTVENPTKITCLTPKGNREGDYNLFARTGIMVDIVITNPDSSAISSSSSYRYVNNYSICAAASHQYKPQITANGLVAFLHLYG
jgi:hypothetical protein